MRPLVIVILSIALAGALGGFSTTAGAGDTDVPLPEPVLDKPPAGDATLTAIGDLHVSDAFDRARQVFPAPAGSHIESQPELTLAGERHFGWSTELQVFDAFAFKEKLTTVSLLKTGLTDAERQTQIDRELERFDEPNENAEGRTAAAYLWRDGDYVRIVIDFFGGDNRGVLKVSGTKNALAARGFPVDNLADLVAAFDERAVQ
jgi:hypothetical protein